MLILKLWSYLTGYLIIRVKGATLEKFINMANQRGIRLWGIRRATEDILFVNAGIGGFRAMRPIARKVHCQIRIVRRRGLPFFILSLRRRKLLLAGIFLFFFTIYTLSSYIWFIEVVGTKQIPAERIRQIAGEAGLRVGAPKSAVVKETIEKRLLNALDQLAWVGVDVKGTRVVIEVSEKRLADPEKMSPAHLVAARDGLITSIIVFSGQPMVQVGDTVHKGQVLVSGIIAPWVKKQQETLTAPPGSASGSPPGNHILVNPVAQAGGYYYVRAEAVVEARIWYEKQVRVPLREQVFRRTGRSRDISGIVVGGKTIWLGGRVPPFRKFDRQTVTSRLFINRKVPLPVELKKVTYYELERIERVRTREEALQEAVVKAKRLVQKEARAGAVRVAEQVETFDTKDAAGARVILEVRDEIQSLRPVKVGDKPPF